MVKIRLKRMGAMKQPKYRIVVADSRAPRDGRIIEEIGFYNPLTDPSEVRVNDVRAREWLAQGAKPSNTVRVLFSRVGIR